ncbi:hypothetical protein ACFL5G_04085 [Candidatus Margulisiibacteriota bacterium]
MVTENDVVIQKIRYMVKRDWKVKGVDKELPPHATIIFENGVVQIDPRFTTHA